MEAKKRNKNALRSRELLRKAYLELIKTKKIDQITVTELVNTAGLNRATFYAHYTCIRDITDEIQLELVSYFKSVMRNFEYKKFTENPTEMLLQLSLVLSENEELIRTLVNYGEVSSFIRELQDMFVDYMLNDISIPDDVKATKNYKLYLYYFSGGIVNIYLKYFRGELEYSLYDIPLFISTVLKSDFMATLDDGRNQYAAARTPAMAPSLTAVAT